MSFGFVIAIVVPKELIVIVDRILQKCCPKSLLSFVVDCVHRLCEKPVGHEYAPKMEQAAFGIFVQHLCARLLFEWAINVLEN